MGKVNGNSYVFSPNTGCRFLSIFFGIFALGLLILLFQSFLNTFGKVLTIFAILLLFGLFWITNKLSQTRAKVDDQGITIWNGNPSTKIYADWDDFIIAYRLRGIKGETTFVFAKESMNTAQIKNALKASFSYKTGISFAYEKTVCISAGFHEKKIESFFANRIPIQDV